MTRAGWTARLGLAASITALSFGVMLAGSPQAFADGPVWKALSTTEPTHLVKSQNEIEELTVTATEGEIFVLVFGHGGGIFPYNLSAAEMQAGLEEKLGTGNVEVTGGPGDAGGTKPYLITFTGEFAGQELTMFSFGIEAETNVITIQKAVSSGTVLLTAINVGGPTDGSTVTISDTLPAGVAGTSVAGYQNYGPKNGLGGGNPLECKESQPSFTCTYTGVVETGDALSERIPVVAGSGAPSGALNDGMIVGGGAELAGSVSAPLTISETPASFGVAPGGVVMATSSRQAGAHPDVTTSFDLATSGREIPAGNVKDVRVDLPPGLVGNTVGMPRCTTARAVRYECPRDTIVGVASVTAKSLFSEGQKVPALFIEPVFNIAPSPGEPAAFMFTTVNFPVRLDTSLLSDGDYAVRVTAADISEADPVLGSMVTIWGVPADHEGPGPIKLQAEVFGELAGGLGGRAANVTRVPLLTNPTQCSSPLTGRLDVDEWGAPGVFSGESASLGTMTGCGELSFSGSMSMLPDTLEAGAPAGYDFNLHVPQVNDPNGLSQPNVKKVVTALPMGTVVSPSAAVGLKSCGDDQFFGPVAERGLEEPARPGDCPRDSQVGTISIRTPALELPLTGDVYLASPDCEPCSPGRENDSFVRAGDRRGRIGDRRETRRSRVAEPADRTAHRDVR
jgi:hypothetical protein